MEAKVHHIAFVSAKELVKDGYHVAGFGFDEKKLNLATISYMRMATK